MMNRQLNSIDDYLLARWISGDISGHELEQVKDWAALSPDNKKLLRETQSVADNIEHLKIMESINSATALKRVKKRIGHHDTVGRTIFAFWKKIAAIIVLPLLLYNLYQIGEGFMLDSTKISWNKISTPVGLRSDFVLPDGTKVSLNGNTSLKYPSKFLGDERLVELEGEAFFKVSTNKKKPFVINVRELRVQAVGTSFNVSAYPDDVEIKTVLIEGIVNLMYSTKKGDEKTVLLSPGQLATYNNSTQDIHLSEGDISKHLAWLDGGIYFRNDSLEEVLRKLGRWYNVDFHISESVHKGYFFTGSFKNESLHQILEYVELTTPVKFKFSNPKKINDSIFAKRYVEVVMRE